MSCKKGFALILAAFMMLPTANVTASAETDTYILNEGIAPAAEYVNSAKSTLTISSGTAKCSSNCTSLSEVVQVRVEQTLEKHSGWFWIWNNVDGASWSTTKSGSYAAVVNAKNGLSSGTYRVKSEFTLTASNGETETITIYSEEKTVS